MQPCILYITYPSKEEAIRISKILIEEKLAACVNIFAPVLSIYEWEKEIKHDEEIVVITKTIESKVDEAIERVKSLHYYNCPCIIALEIKKGNENFIKWVESSLKVE